MDVDVTFTIDDKAALRYMSDVQQRQLPFATSLALNNTMKIAQKDVRREYERRFTQRNTTLAKALTTIPRGEFATKHKLRVRMMNVKDGRTGKMAGEGFVERQMSGAVKTPRGTEIAIPVIGPGMRRLKSGSIPKGKKAKARTDLVRIKNTLYEPQKRKKLVPRFTLTKSAAPSRAGRFNYLPVGKSSIMKNVTREWMRAMKIAARTAR